MNLRMFGHFSVPHFSVFSVPSLGGSKKLIPCAGGFTSMNECLNVMSATSVVNAARQSLEH
jgi:hypothetical protein